MHPDGKWTSTRAVLLAAAGQNRRPPAGSYMAATGQDLMAADSGFEGPLLEPLPRHVGEVHIEHLACVGSNANMKQRL